MSISASGAPTTRRATSIPSRCCRRPRRRRPLPRRRRLRLPPHRLRRRRLLRCRPRRIGSATTGRPRRRCPSWRLRWFGDLSTRRPRRACGRSQTRAVLSIGSARAERVHRRARGRGFVLRRLPIHLVVGEPRRRLVRRIQFASLPCPRRPRPWRKRLGPQSRRRRTPAGRRGDSRPPRCSLWPGSRFWPRTG
jgi:hypothetical protein